MDSAPHRHLRVSEKCVRAVFPVGGFEANDGSWHVMGRPDAAACGIVTGLCGPGRAEPGRPAAEGVCCATAHPGCIPTQKFAVRKGVPVTIRFKAR